MSVPVPFPGGLVSPLPCAMCAEPARFPGEAVEFSARLEDTGEVLVLNVCWSCLRVVAHGQAVVAVERVATPWTPGTAPG